jgi:hypothetical protein
MHNTTKLFPGFHQCLFGRKPITTGTQLARTAHQADTLCLTQLHTLFKDVLTPRLATFKNARGSKRPKLHLHHAGEFLGLPFPGARTRRLLPRRSDTRADALFHTRLGMMTELNGLGLSVSLRSAHMRPPYYAFFNQSRRSFRLLAQTAPQL